MPVLDMLNLKKHWVFSQQLEMESEEGRSELDAELRNRVCGEAAQGRGSAVGVRGESLFSLLDGRLGGGH